MVGVQVELEEDLVDMLEELHRPVKQAARELIVLELYRQGEISSGKAAEDLKTEYAVNGRRSADELERRIRLHLVPYFGGRRLAMISTPDVNAFILKRQKDVMVVGEGDDRQERKYSNGEINRELTTLKRIFNLARQNGKLSRCRTSLCSRSGTCGPGSSNASSSNACWIFCRRQ